MTTALSRKYSPEEVYQILKDYKWMLNTVKEMRESLEKTDGVAISKYGIESQLPSGKGEVGDVVLGEVIRRSKQWRRIEAYEERIRFVQSNLYKIKNCRELEVLNWFIDGKSMKEIAKLINVSSTQVYRIINKIVNLMTI